MDEIIARGLNAKRESKYIEFKSSFDSKSGRDWCEIIKHIVAISNTGDGVIIFGLIVPLVLLVYTVFLMDASILRILAGITSVLLLAGGLFLRYSVISAGVRIGVR